MSKRIFGMFIAVLLIAVMMIPAFAETIMYVKTNTGIGLNVRSTPEVRKDNGIGSIK